MFVLTVAKTFRGLRTRDWYRRNNLMALVIRDGKLQISTGFMPNNVPRIVFLRVSNRIFNAFDVSNSPSSIMATANLANVLTFYVGQFHSCSPMFC